MRRSPGKFGGGMWGERLKLRINSSSKDSSGLSGVPFSTPQWVLPQCKGPSCLEERDHGHGTQGMLEVGEWAKPAAQVCHHVQGSVGCRKAL